MNVDSVIDLSQRVDAIFNAVIDVQFSILFHWKNFIPVELNVASVLTEDVDLCIFRSIVH